MKLSELRFSRLRVFVFGQSNTVFLITFWQWQLINYWDDCHLELIPRPSSTTEMNFPRAGTGITGGGSGYIAIWRTWKEFCTV